MVSGDRRAAVLLLGLVPVAIACVPALPGGPYDSPGETGSGAAGSGGGRGGSTASGGGASTGSAATGGSSGPGGPGAACGFPWPVSVSPPNASLPAGASTPFQVTVTNPSDPGCPAQSPNVSCSSADPRLSLRIDSSQWFTGPLFPGQTTSSLLSVVTAPGAAAGGSGFTCTVSVPGVHPSSASATVAIGGVGPPPAPCAGVPAPTAPIFDGSMKLAPYAIAGAGLMPPILMPVDAAVMTVHVTAAPGVTPDPSQAWVGFGFSFVVPSCVNASMFSGVQFTIVGNVEAGCGTLSFDAVTSEDTSTTSNMLGACTAPNCVPSSSGPIALGTTVVRFIDMFGGTPMTTVDPMALLGIQWTLHLPPGASASCAADLTISHVAFVP